MNTEKTKPAKKINRQNVKKVNIETRKKKDEETETKKPGKLSLFFNRFSTKVTRISGSVYTFIAAVVLIIVWIVTGPIFKFSDTWQLVINTGTTIVTFLMVFIIQHSQNKDTIALQLKLNELIKASKASNKLISVEDLSDEELALMKKFYEHISGLSKEEKEDKVEEIDEEEVGDETIQRHEKSNGKSIQHK